jgi:putative SOS response-associated peptidase YedK
MVTIHDRVPVILTEHGERLRMDADAPTEDRMSVLTSCLADLMDSSPVSTVLNRAERGAAEMVEPPVV